MNFKGEFKRYLNILNPITIITIKTTVLKVTHSHTQHHLKAASCCRF